MNDCIMKDLVYELLQTLFHSLSEAEEPLERILEIDPDFLESN